MMVLPDPELERLLAEEEDYASQELLRRQALRDILRKPVIVKKKKPSPNASWRKSE